MSITNGKHKSAVADMRRDIEKRGNTAPGYNVSNRTQANGQSNSNNPVESRIEFESLERVHIEFVRWLVPSRLPAGKMVTIAADGGTGKSALVRHVAAKLTTGQCAFGMTYDPPPACDVILLADEDGYADTVVPHLIAEGADLSRIHRVRVATTDSRGNITKLHIGPQHIHELKAEIRKHPDVKLIVIDPVISWASRAKIDDSRAGEVREILDPLAALAEATGVTIVLVAHLNKASNAKASHRVAGSAQYLNGVRLAYLLEIDPDDNDRRFVMPIKKNLRGVSKESATFTLRILDEAERRTVRKHPSMESLTDPEFDAVVNDLGVVQFGENLLLQPDEVMGKRRTNNGEGQIEKCEVWLKEFLSANAYPSNEISEAGKAAGFSQNAVYKAKTNLKDSAGLRNKKDGLGNWWCGLGDPYDWKRRPEPSTSSRGTPSSTSSTSSTNSKTPDNNNVVELVDVVDVVEHVELVGGLMGVPDEHPPERYRRKSKARGAS